MSLLQAASVLVLAFYILSLLAGSRLASKAAGRSVWLFGAARGRDRIAALGFRASFALALLGPVIWALMPDLSALSLGGWTGYPWLT
ncbi:MAG: isoprenylcysteine carboxylmethyltransferase family protein, partial [Tritonibacter mobilis]|nr:isoprenylcysteine carboxylmethyltransferase family protein [Tritonibacter mobilis]